jgi:hypothetical protein
VLFATSLTFFSTCIKEIASLNDDADAPKSASCEKADVD